MAAWLRFNSDGKEGRSESIRYYVNLDNVTHFEHVEGPQTIYKVFLVNSPEPICVDRASYEAAGRALDTRRTRG